MLLIRAGHRICVTVVTFGLLRFEDGEHIRWESGLCMNCEEISGGTLLLSLWGPPIVLLIRTGHRNP
eukprot:8649652-Pyramimonas_sp.AAC.1